MDFITKLSLFSHKNLSIKEICNTIPEIFTTNNLRYRYICVYSHELNSFWMIAPNFNTLREIDHILRKLITSPNSSL